jgi:hypothetical protein
MMIQSEGKSISLAIEGYQFPNQKIQKKGYDYDANWLNVIVCYADANVSERYIDACLLTYELESCIEEIDEVVEGKETLYISDFMEPYLKIAVMRTGASVVIGMVFAYDVADRIWKERKVSETVSLERAKGIVEELKEYSARYPQRTK